MAKKAYLDGQQINPLFVKRQWAQLLTEQIKSLEYCLLARSYISVSELLKLLIDMADIYSKLLHDNSALEILKMVSDEIAKIIAKNRNFHDIDITRLKRLGIVMVNTELGGQFRVEDLSLELPVLTQMILYRKGIIHKELSNYKRAAEYFSRGIQETEFFSPAIREYCTNELYKLLSKYNLLTYVQEIPELHAEFQVSRQNLFFVFSYRIGIHTELNSILCDLIEDSLGDYNLGAISGYSKSQLMIEPVKRDHPGADFSRFLTISEHRGFIQEHVYDTIARAVKCLKSLPNSKILILLLEEISSLPGFTTLANLRELLSADFQLIVLEIAALDNEEFRDFIERNTAGNYIDASDVHSAVDKLQQTLSSLLL